MSPTDTAGNGKARTRVGTTRRRALMALAGAGVLAAVPITVEATTSGAVAKGQAVVVTAKTPAPVKRALAGNGPVVVAFLLPHMTEDEIVQRNLNALRRQGKFKDTKFIVYRITNSTKLGDLPTLFDVKYTPAVAVIQGDNKLSNVWRGLVDQDIIAQSLIDARAAVPQPIAVEPKRGAPSGSAAGIALAKRVDARYVKVPGLSAQFTGTIPGVGSASGSGQVRLVDGKQRVFGASVTALGKNVQVFANPTGLYAKSATGTCWVRNTSPKAVADIGTPVIPLAGVKFGKPAASADKKTVTLRALDVLGQYGGGATSYVIDATTFNLVSATHGKAKQSFKNLDATPAIAKPDKVC